MQSSEAPAALKRIFKNFWMKEYVGETECLSMRIRDHQQKSKDTAIFAHTEVCDDFKTGFTENFEQNNFKSRFSYLSSMFSILHKNLSYDKRKQMEGLEIVLRDPSLNKQVKHKKVFIL